jgi:hypothetical protein
VNRVQREFRYLRRTPRAPQQLGDFAQELGSNARRPAFKLVHGSGRHAQSLTQLLFAHSACNSAQPNSDCLPRRRLYWAQRASKGISAGSQLRFLEIVAEALDSSDFGFRLAQQGDVREAGVLYHGMAASQDLGEALRNLARYLKVANESVRVVVCEKADDTVLLVVRKVAKQDERHVVEFALTVLLRGCRKMTGCRLRPKAVTFAHGRNADVAEFERFFECPVLFRADADAIVVPNGAALNSHPLIQQLSTENFEGALREHYG